jgi:predicted transcriptional regulator of viral defense system
MIRDGYVSYTYLHALEEGLAAEGRRVVSPWRAALILYRATKTLPPASRRWEKPPASAKEAQLILARLSARGALRKIDASANIYQVTSPFASSSPIQDYEILFEANPYCSLSHHTALLFHHLTDTYSHTVHVFQPAPSSSDIPLGTTSRDWDFYDPPQGKKLKKIGTTPVIWHSLTHTHGTREYREYGYTIQVTDVERTLLDGLLEPDWCGGFENVVRAWKEAQDRLNLALLVHYVDTFNSMILRQRVGFILKKLNLPHPALSSWKTTLSHGGSSRLVAKNPFSSQYDEEWFLSINADVSVLEDSV